MDEDGFGSSGVWNICSYISLYDVVLSVYYWDYLQVGLCNRRSVALLVWIGIWTKLRVYRVLPDSARWSCRGFGFLWQAFMMNWMPWTKNDLKIFHRKQVNASQNMKLVKSLINFEFQPFGIFEGLSCHQEDKVIDTILHWGYLLIFFQRLLGPLSLLT